ncbi:MAG: hypothetical protein PHY72_02670 [Candidatus Pacebacteria bacterium]|nr:hypothetical protein [Candidatus Paceibacterota bacterium]
MSEQNEQKIEQEPDNSGDIVVRDEKTGQFIEGHPKLGGKPKGFISITAIIRQELDEIPPGQKKTYLEFIVDRILGLAVEGNTAAIKMIWAYVDGKPVETILTHEAGNLEELTLYMRALAKPEFDK